MENISEQISCPVCFKIPENEIFQCRNGHNICGLCSTSMVRCPECRVPYGEVKVRNRAVEAIVESLKVDCPNKANGCPDRLLPDSLEPHKESCEYSANNVKLCQLIGFNCGHKMNITNVSSVIQHLQSEHGATSQTVSKFCMKLDGIPSQCMAGEDKTWRPYIIKLAETNIVVAAHLKNENLSCVGIILEESTVQESRRFMECQIKSLIDESIHMVWQSPILSPTEIARRGTAPAGPLRMDYILHYFMSADGLLSINVCISQVEELDGKRGHQRTGAIAKTMYDSVRHWNKTQSMKTGDIDQVIEKRLMKPDTEELPETSMSRFGKLYKRIQCYFIVQALCLYPYEAWNEEEITLKKGDIVRVISKDIYYGWWKCEFNGKTGLVPENKLTVVTNIGSSEPDEKSTNVVTSQFRWVKCKEGKCGTRQNSVINGYQDSAVRGAIPGLNFKVPGCLFKGETTAVICFKNVTFRVSEYEILCIPEGYWMYSQNKNWGKLIPEGAISTGISPDGTESYLGYPRGLESMNAKEGYSNRVTGRENIFERKTGYCYILAAKP